MALDSGAATVALPICSAPLRRLVERLLLGGGDSVADRRPMGPAQSETRKRVLVAEDNPVNRVVARRLLEGLGYDVEEAHDGEQAVRAVGERAFDAILMDCQMPVLDGYQASKQIRRLSGAPSRTPIIAVTANALAGDRDRCIAAGMDDYVAKPIDSRRLAEVLDRVLGPSSTGGELRSATSTEPAGPTQPTFNGEPTLDLSTIEELRRFAGDDGDELVREVVGLFLESARKFGTVLGEAVAARDAAATAAAAHRIRGGSLNVGAKRLAAQAVDIETRARRNPEEDLRPSLDALIVELARVEDRLRPLLASGGSALA